MKTSGWDTVFVVNEARLNKLLETHADQVTLDFDVEIPGIEGARAIGKFAPWQIAQGGSNDIIHLRLEIASGTLTTGSENIDLSGVTLVIATYLDWLSIDNQKEQLQFDYNRLGEGGNPPDRGELSVVKLLDPNGVLSPQENALVSFSLGTFLVENADQVRFVFATVNLIAPKTNSWLTPVKNAYGYFHREGLDAGFLAIFSVTTDRDISSLQRTVDPAAIPVTTDASYVISGELFLNNVIAPGLAKSFSTDISAFYYDAAAGLLRNTRKLAAKAVKSGAIWYYPVVDQLEVRSAENALTTYAKGNADMYAGIWLNFTVSSRNVAQYSASDGSLNFLTDPAPKESHNADIPWWFFLAGPIVIAITAIVVKVISDDIAKDIADENKERLALGKHPPSSILVGANDAINVTSITVNDALLVSGNI
ncbi:MAG: TULIP family P47-like protein [Pseudomonadota bacterium]